MRHCIILTTLLSFLFLNGYAQTDVDTAGIKSLLSAIYERDQKTRKRSDSLKYATLIDSSNLAMIEPLIARFGWPGKDFVGLAGNVAVFVVIQHASLAVQEKYLPLLEKSVADSQSRPSDYAMMKDRVLMRQGKKQLYGSQVVTNKTTGAMEFYPIEDEANVNSRRVLFDLPPIEEYARYFGIRYTAPDK